MLTGLYWPTTVRGRLRHRQSTAPATTPRPTISLLAELAGADAGVFGVCSVPFVGGFFEARSAALSASSVAATAPTRRHVGPLLQRSSDPLRVPDARQRCSLPASTLPHARRRWRGAPKVFEVDAIRPARERRAEEAERDRRREHAVVAGDGGRLREWLVAL